MTNISNVNNSLLQSQLTNIQLRNAIDYKVASKTLDVARNQGDMVIKLLEQAAEVAQAAPSDKPVLTMGALVSGLGQNLDIRG